MAEELTVYLDHLIERESFRYTRAAPLEYQAQQQLVPHFRLADLREPDRVRKIRKPDFQRATWAWTPEDCVSLLEAIVQQQVVPSIIMWSNEKSGLDYILDGGHRISVVLAWLQDDWGDKRPPDLLADEEDAKRIEEAARRVRSLVRERVGTRAEFEEAEKEFFRLMEENKN